MPCFDSLHWVNFSFARLDKLPGFVAFSAKMFLLARTKRLHSLSTVWLADDRPKIPIISSTQKTNSSPTQVMLINNVLWNIVHLSSIRYTHSSRLHTAGEFTSKTVCTKVSVLLWVGPAIQKGKTCFFSFYDSQRWYQVEHALCMFCACLFARKLAMQCG